MIKLIIFDWDDVLTLGSKEGYLKCYHETLIELGVSLSPEEEKRRILAKWSRPHREELAELLKESPHLLDKACEIYESKLFGGAFVDSLRILRGTVPLLKRLGEKYILCVATGMHPKILKENVIQKFGIPQVFSQIISTYEIKDTAKHKPDAYIAGKILSSQNCRPEEAILVGDAKEDVLMAKNAGITPVVVLTGHLGREEAEKLNVEFIIEDVTHLELVLEKLNNPKAT
ncbi:HAD family hydrolase [Candidatus Woesearchaeota archaeon]|nr:HAD family hydrolase [Candidatus Woesearchaeota archaeon]